MYDRSQKGYFTLCIIRLSGRCFFVAGKLPTVLRLLTYRFESQYHSEYLTKKENTVSGKRMAQRNGRQYEENKRNFNGYWMNE